MKHIWQLAVREIAQRALIFAVALALGFVGPILGWLRSIDVPVVSLVFAVGLGHGVALLVGATTVNRPLREGRLSFFFNRPLSEGDLWWGKVLGTFLLAAGVQLVTFVPALVWALFLGTDLSDALPILGASVGGLLGSVLIGHVFGTMIGARSKASLADLAALVVSASLLWFAWTRLSELFANTAQVVLLSLVGFAGLAGALIGGWRQVKLGRVDGGRSHRALSLSVWTATLTAALLGFGFSSWVRDVDPAEMGVLAVSSGSSSPWFVTQQMYFGEDVRQGVTTQFLVHAETGQWQTLALGRAGRLRAQVSKDSSRVVWTQGADGCFAEGWAADNAGGELSKRRRLPTGVCDVSTWRLSPSGDRVADVAYLDQNSRPDEMNVRVRVWDVQTGRPHMQEWLTVRRLRDVWTPGDALFWDDDGSLRLFVDDGWKLHLWRLEPESETTTKLATLDVGDGNPRSALLHNGRYYGGAAALRFAPGGEQVLVATYSESEAEAGTSLEAPLFETPPAGSDEAGQEDTPERPNPRLEAGRARQMSVVVWDGKLQQRLYTLPPATGMGHSVRFLPRHVVVTARSDEGRMVLRVGGPEGWRHELSWTWPVGFHGEAVLDVVGREGKRSLLDLDSGELEPLGGEVRKHMKGLRYMLSQIDTSGRDRRGDDGVEPGLAGLYGWWGEKTEGPSVVRFDPQTGEVAPFFEKRR
ncbi:MAG: hypothetical protein AAF690_22065 [Acidobacteriota bacterium]